MGSRHYKPRNFDFAQLFVTLRKRIGLTQEALALRLGVSEKSVRNWEGGSNYPAEVHLRKLIELYLTHNAFNSGHEQNEAHALWDQVRENSPHHISVFQEQWFGSLLAKGQNYHPNRFLREDWSEAVDVSSFYGRNEELAELKRWLLTDQCRLVAVLGMGGIGKTTLSVKLARQMSSQFDCVLWCSLYNAPSLEELLLDWLPAISAQPDISIPQELDQSLAYLLKLLRQRRCLLVLDNLETLLQEKVQGGNYRQGYEAYALLIRQIAGSVHRSCLLLTCREQIPDLEVFSGKQAPVRVLRLDGLPLPVGQQLLLDKELFGDQRAWSELIQRYGGNPLALKIVAETIRELFGGDIAAFLAEGFTTFHGIRQLLTQQFERLSSREQALLYWLALERELVSLEVLQTNLRYPVTKSEVIGALHSLRNRSLVERGKQGATFTLQPVVLEYVTEQFVARVSEEIRDNKPMVLLAYPLLKAQARDYIRTSQARLILQPVLDTLLTHFNTTHSLEEHLELLLQKLRLLPHSQQGYGGGNVVNLFVQLNGHIKGKDCSQLSIWQAYLQEGEAQDATFLESDLTGSVFIEPFDSILSVALSPDGHYLAAGSNRGQIHVWQADNGLPLFTLQAHSRLAWSLAFHPEGTLLASGGYEGLVKVWEVKSGQCMSVLRGHSKWVKSVAFHPAGKLLATGSDDRSIRLWNLIDGSCIKMWQEQSSEVWSVAFSPDGQLLAWGQADGLVSVWDVTQEHILWSCVAHQGLPVPSLAFSLDGGLLVSAGNDSMIMVWQASGGEHLTTLSEHTDVIPSVAFNTEGLLASGSFDHTVKVWQIGLKGAATRYLGTLRGHTNWIWSIAFGPDGLLASGGHDGVVKLWQINREGGGEKCLRTLRGYSRLVNAAVFSPDGGMLVSCESNGMMRVRETHTGRCLHVLSWHAGDTFAMAFSPDGQLFVSSSPNKTISLWDAKSWQCLMTLKGHQGPIWSVAFSPDGHFLMSGSFDMTIKWWEVSSGRCLRTLQGHHNWVWSLAFSPDGALLASGDVDGVTKLWVLGSGQCLHTLHGSPQPILALAFTPDGQTLLSSNARDLVTLWDVKSGGRLKVMPGGGEAYWLGSVAFSSDGSLLTTASRDQTVKIWDVNSGEIRRILPCHIGQPWSVALSTDQRLLAGGTDEGTLLFWEWQTGEQLMTLQSERPYERMNICGVTGVTEAQKASLKILGAIEKDAETER